MLHVNELHILIKRHRVANWTKKEAFNKLCTRDLFENERHTDKLRGWENKFHVNGNKKEGVATVISDRIDFKTKPVTKDKKGHYIMIKG